MRCKNICGDSVNHFINLKVSVISTILISIVIFSSSMVWGQATLLIPPGATWKYLDDGSDQGKTWRSPAFDDSAWLEGPAELGYGDSDEATVVSYGPDPSDKYAATYFRHSFNIPSDAPIYDNLTLSIKRDDGATVYLNGSEVYRTNMPAGAATYTTLAVSGVGGSGETTFYNTSIDHSLLVDGTNVIAVEIHQSNVASSDISFDLALLVDALQCEIEMSQAVYTAGDTVTAQVFSIANNGIGSASLEWKVWLGTPFGSPISIVNMGANGTFVLPQGYNLDLGPLSLFSAAILPAGFYEFSARLLDPTTGETLCDDLNVFEIQ